MRVMSKNSDLKSKGEMMGQRRRKPWKEEQKDLELLGYKFDKKGTCIYDPNVKVEPPKVKEVKVPFKDKVKNTLKKKRGK